ncbi:MAG: SOS response-associated peptidase [Saprospiraceae bacterium]|nr:SOS response-associated peptidase [Saprospiraceae bacterium]
MCGRSSLTKNEKELEARFGSTFYSEDLERYNPLPNFNVCPGHVMPIKDKPNATHFTPSTWGVNLKFGPKTQLLINARSETMAEKKTFSSVLYSGRCIVPMDGYYEWRRSENTLVPYYIHFENRLLVAAAGLNFVNSATNENHFIVLTRPSEGSLRDIHDRMPVFLEEKEYSDWLTPLINSSDILSIINRKIIIPPYFYPVSSKINSSKNNEPDLILPSKNIDFKQGSLF